MEFIAVFTGIQNIISEPWHWAFSGFMIAVVLFFMNWLGKSFGISTTFKVMCSAVGAGKKYSFFNMNLKDEYWRIAFAIGTIFGGFLTYLFFQSPEPVAISESTINQIQEWGLIYPETVAEGRGLIPEDLFNFSNPLGIVILIVGGFLVGFGARYGAGCTSGHAITGLAHLQLPSLITVIGFFIGGLLMTWVLMPLIFKLI